MNAIVTVVGKDRVGIIAAVCTKLAQCNINILDISQTILQGEFTMVMAIDVDGSNLSVSELSREMSALGTEMNLSIRLQREDIFNAMHSI
jgi:ACT domain-containing protein